MEQANIQRLFWSMRRKTGRYDCCKRRKYQLFSTQSIGVEYVIGRLVCMYVCEHDNSKNIELIAVQSWTMF